MSNFWDSSVWGFINLIAVLLASMLFANLIKKSIKPLRNSLIPTSVLGGVILLLISLCYQLITGNKFFNLSFFDGFGVESLEIITYHCLALGFIANTFQTKKQKLTKERSKEVFNTGVTTVSTYLIQAILGICISIVFAAFVSSLKNYSYVGVLLPFGFGQGTGQALNYGSIYENDWGFIGGKSFGLTVAALGFLSASIGGVVHLNVLKRKGKIKLNNEDVIKSINSEEIQSPDEISMNGSIDKMTIQIAIILTTYIISFGLMFALGALLPSLKSILFGFNFIFGVLIASLIKLILGKLENKKIVKKKYVNPFLMNRIGGFFFDLMIVAGVAAIQLEFIKNYVWLLLALAIFGFLSTYLYNDIVARILFKKYKDEQFLAMFGMLTGTASTGVILLREIDPEFKTPVMDNLVYQNFPAIVFGFPIMLLANLAPNRPFVTLWVLLALFVVMNIILFRQFIFRRRKPKGVKAADGEKTDGE